MIGCLRTHVGKQPIIVLYFEVTRSQCMLEWQLLCEINRLWWHFVQVVINSDCSRWYTIANTRGAFSLTIRDAFTRKYIIWPLNFIWGQGHKKYCLIPSTSCDLCTRPSSPVRQDGERRTTFLDEYAFRRVPFSRFGSFFFVLTSDFQFNDTIINNARCACHP